MQQFSIHSIQNILKNKSITSQIYVHVLLLTDWHTDRPIEKQTDGGTDEWSDGQNYGRTDRKTDKQTYWWLDKYCPYLKCFCSRENNKFNKIKVFCTVIHYSGTFLHLAWRSAHFSLVVFHQNKQRNYIVRGIHRQNSPNFAQDKRSYKTLPKIIV